MCEVVYGFDIEVDDEEAFGKSLKVEPPRFLRVESARLWSRPIDLPGRRSVEFKVVLDTTRVGDLAVRLKIECDNHKVEQPVRARILPDDAERPKVLVITRGLDVAARDGGELILIGQPLFPYCFSDKAEPFRDDARLLRKLPSRSRAVPR